MQLFDRRPLVGKHEGRSSQYFWFSAVNGTFITLIITLPICSWKKENREILKDFKRAKHGKQFVVGWTTFVPTT